MSEVIRFPKMQQKLINDIDEAMYNEQYETAYDLFNAYEKHFELSEILALKKCHVLWALESYLELKEETHILLLQGYQPYDELMIYYVKSLYALSQYQAVVTVIEQVLNHVKTHQTRLLLLPIKDQAQEQLNVRKEDISQQLQRFHQLSLSVQTELILSLIDESMYQFADTIAYLMQYEEIGATLQSLMLEYLRFAGYNQNIQFQQFDQTHTIVPEALPGVEQTHFKESIVPQIITWLESEMPSMVQEAYVHLNTHNIVIYPVDVTKMANDETWVYTYQMYFQEMMGLPVSHKGDKRLLEWIKMLNT
ncbi:hypothetical protein [Staphylococcus sp. 17KM0847]|uniref:hypothetical protein n=1 Tax=Staphylococcus sp. 17KM0847 TaxID=2583989 RepID=UPI0015DC48F5|nr:hypothetical protein [Staphylococcus sp. 17KM0847]QLK85961.1 hypothetical protein FGL66_04195 [Staphylococcus sp. 17KM0847]